MKQPVASTAIVFLVLALSSWTGIAVGAQTDANIRVIDLEISAARPVGWVDNQTFVVMLKTDERYRRKDGAEVQIARVATINYRTGERKTYGKVSSQLCFADGYVSYVFADYATGELFASYGELGRETVRKMHRGDLVFDKRSCRLLSETGPVRSRAPGKPDVFHLWPKLGEISCNVHSYSPASRNVMASFFKAGEDRGIDLPFSCYDIHRGFRYYAFRGAFFTAEQAVVTPWPVGRDRKAFWLFPDGRVETIVLPYSSAIRENMVPTARGIVAFGHPAGRSEDYGVYIITDEGTKQVLRGQAAGITSPDGCSVAMLHDPEFDSRVDGRRPRARVTLKVLKLC